MLIFQSLGDLNQPYSCTQWGNVATNGMPLITDDTGMPIFGLFHTDNLLPSAVYIDHTMTVHYKHAGHDSESAINDRIQDMLNNLYGAPILTANSEISMDNELDNDGVLNPEEGFSVIYTFTNNSFETDAINATAILSIDDGGTIISDENIEIGDIALGETTYGEFSILLDDSVPFGDFNIHLYLTADYINNFGELAEYLKEVSISINVSLNQSGFPVSTAELRASPLVIDLDGDGDNEIIFGDNNGFVHIYNADGSEVEDATFPFDTGNQIWGSAAAADMDRDGFTDFVITSKSKHLYIFDQNGLKTDYNANKYLMGTPAIGNLDGDADLEVVIGGYSSPASSNQIFAINPDGSDVDGFPLVLGEKTKAGVALADFNGNGKDDIIVGTDDNNIYVIHDDGSVAPGFPYTAGDKIQAAPSVADIDGGKVVFSGSNDNSFYAVNSDGSLRFTIQTGDKVQSSPSFLDHNGETYIFFGSNDDMIYAVDSDGNTLSGWPVGVNGTVGASVVFSDLDNDGEPEVVAATDGGDILAFNMDGSYVNYFPIANEFPSSSSPIITQLDDDGDLEIVAGSGSNLVVIDIKENGNTLGYWNKFMGGNNRRGYNSINGNCMDLEACNYDSDADVDDGTCIYKRVNADCSGACIDNLSEDVCGVCGGSGAIYECGCRNISIGTCDCYNNILDECDICGGDNTTCTGCTNPDASNHDPEAIIDDGSCILDIDDVQIVPESFSISNIYPNPFNPVITIKYGLPDYVPVKIAMYDIWGRQVAVLVDNYQSPGFHSLSWVASSYPSGLYFIQITSYKFSETRKILLIK